MLTQRVLSKRRVLKMAFPPSSAQHRGLDDGKGQNILCFLEVVSLVKQGILVDRLPPVLALGIHNVCLPQ